MNHSPDDCQLLAGLCEQHGVSPKKVLKLLDAVREYEFKDRRTGVYHALREFLKSKPSDDVEPPGNLVDQRRDMAAVPAQMGLEEMHESAEERFRTIPCVAQFLALALILCGELPDVLGHAVGHAGHAVDGFVIHCAPVIFLP